MERDALTLVVLGVLTIAAVFLITEMIQTVRELRRQATEEDPEQ